MGVAAVLRRVQRRHVVGDRQRVVAIGEHREDHVRRARLHERGRGERVVAAVERDRGQGLQRAQRRIGARGRLRRGAVVRRAIAPGRDVGSRRRAGAFASSHSSTPLPESSTAGSGTASSGDDGAPSPTPIVREHGDRVGHAIGERGQRARRDPGRAGHRRGCRRMAPVAVYAVIGAVPALPGASHAEVESRIADDHPHVARRARRARRDRRIDHRIGWSVDQRGIALRGLPARHWRRAADRARHDRDGEPSGHRDDTRAASRMRTNKHGYPPAMIHPEPAAPVDDADRRSHAKHHRQAVPRAREVRRRRDAQRPLPRARPTRSAIASITSLGRVRCAAISSAQAPHGDLSIRRVLDRPAARQQPDVARPRQAGARGAPLARPRSRRAARARRGARPRQRRPRSPRRLLHGLARDARSPRDRPRPALRVRHLRSGHPRRLAGRAHRSLAAHRLPVGDPPLRDRARWSASAGRVEVDARMARGAGSRSARSTASRGTCRCRATARRPRTSCGCGARRRARTSISTRFRSASTGARSTPRSAART